MDVLDRDRPSLQGASTDCCTPLSRCAEADEGGLSRRMISFACLVVWLQIWEALGKLPYTTVAAAPCQSYCCFRRPVVLCTRASSGLAFVDPTNLMCKLHQFPHRIMATCRSLPSLIFWWYGHAFFVCDTCMRRSYTDGFDDIFQDEVQVYRYAQAIDGVYNT